MPASSSQNRWLTRSRVAVASAAAIAAAIGLGACFNDGITTSCPEPLPLYNVKTLKDGGRAPDPEGKLQQAIDQNCVTPPGTAQSVTDVTPKGTLNQDASTS